MVSYNNVKTGPTWNNLVHGINHTCKHPQDKSFPLLCYKWMIFLIDTSQVWSTSLRKYILLYLSLFYLEWSSTFSFTAWFIGFIYAEFSSNFVCNRLHCNTTLSGRKTPPSWLASIKLYAVSVSNTSSNEYEIPWPSLFIILTNLVLFVKDLKYNWLYCLHTSFLSKLSLVHMSVLVLILAHLTTSPYFRTKLLLKTSSHYQYLWHYLRVHQHCQWATSFDSFCFFLFL